MCGSRGAASGLDDLFNLLADGQIASDSFQSKLRAAENDGYLIADLVDISAG